MFYLARGRAARQRPRDLHRLRVGADVDLPAPVLARRRLRAARRRARRRDPLGRRLGLDDAGPAARQGRHGVHAARRSREEVWAQLHDHLDGPRPARRRHVLAWFLDPAIEFPNPTQATNLEPLLVNTAGSWADRPDAVDARSRTSCLAVRLRAHVHRPGDDGGRQRGGAPRGQRDPRRRAGRRRRGARSGRCASRRCSAPRARRSTACAGSCSTARASRRCG